MRLFFGDRKNLKLLSNFCGLKSAVYFFYTMKIWTKRII